MRDPRGAATALVLRRKVSTVSRARHRTTAGVGSSRSRSTRWPTRTCVGPWSSATRRRCHASSTRRASRCGDGSPGCRRRRRIARRASSTARTTAFRPSDSMTKRHAGWSHATPPTGCNTSATGSGRRERSRAARATSTCWTETPPPLHSRLRRGSGCRCTDAWAERGWRCSFFCTRCVSFSHGGAWGR